MQVTNDANTCMFCGGKAHKIVDYYQCDVCKMTWIDREASTKDNKTSD